MRSGAGFALLASAAAACSTAGSTWMAEPLPGAADDSALLDPDALPDSGQAGRAGTPGSRRVVVLGREPASEPPAFASPAGDGAEPALSLRETGTDTAGGRSLGKFRNTYYDFPDERDFTGPTLALRGRDCETLKLVPAGFYGSLCVQGSGRLATGQTVSFSRRNCGCAEVCERTGERICFDALDPRRFPFGRGATGHAITPLYSVAVDSAVIPLGTPLYVPELKGLPRDASGTLRHDGCLLAEDRGIRVRGKQVDVFTGDPRVTALYERFLPSNRGVTVVVGASHCRARAR